MHRCQRLHPATDQLDVWVALLAGDHVPGRPQPDRLLAQQRRQVVALALGLVRARRRSAFFRPSLIMPSF
jgi:hypothetical protein